jgi:hypothetical protein
MATELRACTWAMATARLRSLAPGDGDRMEWKATTTARLRATAMAGLWTTATTSLCGV